MRGEMKVSFGIEVMVRLECGFGELLRAQFERQLCESVCVGALRCGAVLFFFCVLVSEFGIACGVVTEVYLQFVAEGYFVFS